MVEQQQQEEIVTTHSGKRVFRKGSYGRVSSPLPESVVPAFFTQFCFQKKSCLKHDALILFLPLTKQCNVYSRLKSEFSVIIMQIEGRQLVPIIAPDRQNTRAHFEKLIWSQSMTAENPALQYSFELISRVFFVYKISS